MLIHLGTEADQDAKKYSRIDNDTKAQRNPSTGQY